MVPPWLPTVEGANDRSLMLPVTRKLSDRPSVSSRVVSTRSPTKGPRAHKLQTWADVANATGTRPRQPSGKQGSPWTDTSAQSGVNWSSTTGRCPGRLALTSSVSSLRFLKNVGRRILRQPRRSCVSPSSALRPALRARVSWRSQGHFGCRPLSCSRMTQSSPLGVTFAKHWTATSLTTRVFNAKALGHSVDGKFFPRDQVSNTFPSCPDRTRTFVASSLTKSAQNHSFFADLSAGEPSAYRFTFTESRRPTQRFQGSPF